MNTVIQVLSAIVAMEVYMQFELVVVKLIISISGCYSFINRHCHDEMAKHYKFFAGFPLFC
jgi:hypothetical protein